MEPDISRANKTGQLDVLTTGCNSGHKGNKGTNRDEFPAYSPKPQPILSVTFSWTLEERVPTRASNEESPTSGWAFHLKRKGGPLMVYMLVKLTHALLGQLTVRIFWSRK